MNITPDTLVYAQFGHFTLNATLVFSWLVMLLLVAVSFFVTRKITGNVTISRWQNMLEVIVQTIRNQVKEVSQQTPDRYIPFIGSLFLFIALSNLLAVIPGFQAPTSSLSTTVALSICVFLAVPIFGISQQGFWAYFKQYIRPTPFMLPFNIIGELSRTLALAVRLYGNIMSGSVIVAILLGIAPLFFPIVMQMLGLLTGIIQAYIFAILAMVYISSATVAQQKPKAQ